jgi:hypothetical protein
MLYSLVESIISELTGRLHLVASKTSHMGKQGHRERERERERKKERKRERERARSEPEP